MKILMTLLLALALPVQAQSTSSEIGSGLFNAQYLLQVVGSLCLVIFAMLAVLMAMKRFNNVSSSSDKNLQVIGSISLGSRERAVVLRVGSEQLLLGVTPGTITKLHQLSEPLTTSRDAPPLSFKDVLNFARGPRGGEE